MKGKRAGVDAGSASTLIIIIALVLVMYIMFIPPEAREELLENETESSSSKEGKDLANILLDENVGTLEYTEKDQLEYGIGNVYLYETTNAEVIESLNPFITRNGWFEKKFKTLNFGIEDVENTENVILSLSTSKAEGILYIYLNDVLIYEGRMESLTPAPISLKDSLLEEDNTLRFEVGGVGMAFWNTNEYQFEKVEVIGDVTDLSGQEGHNTFNIEEEDYLNIKKAELSFVPYCSSLKDVGKLTIDINGNVVFSAVPICDDSYHQIFDLNMLKKGTNEITFSTNKGSYSVEQIEIDVDLKDSPTKIYYFELNKTQWQDVQDEEKDVWMYMEFVDNGEQKKADINVNGHMRNIDQEEAEYEKDITSWVEEDNNYIEIIPKRTLPVVSLDVVLEEV